MIKLIKMNIYRILHSKSTLIILLVIIAFGLFSAYMEKEEAEMIREAYEKGEYQDTDDEAELQLGVAITTPFHEDGTQPCLLEYVCADISSGILLIMVAIFTVIFVHSEYSSGFVKNIAGQVKGRWMLYLSKTVVVMIFTLFIMLLYALVQGTFLYILLDKTAFGMDMILESLKFLMIQWFMYSAFASGLILVVTVIRSMAVAITFGELAAMGFGQIIAGFINKIVDKDGFNVSEYFLTDNIKMIFWDSANSKLMDALLLAFIFFTVYNLIGMIYVNKKDVNV